MSSPFIAVDSTHDEKLASDWSPQSCDKAIKTLMGKRRLSERGTPNANTTNNYTSAVNNLIRPNFSYAQAASKSQTSNSKPPQQMATLAPTRRKPAMSSINQVVTPSPVLTNFNVEDSSPQQLILQSLQQTIQALTQITQQFAALNFNNPTP
ncbi:hypothetical protein TNIN_7821 [Trichonephila inaurata madagascariensis]|uniref:Uncharacterized protein n=1 Tax=Trichonephila inaurata madagascariensis TaxID=2747483 RepID=A0A8X6WUH2_9ARAC|nr:hypothetical protein TNIN_7821 [Trichonephila inaurata madagascariensis]